MTISLNFVISVCDYVNGNSYKSLDEMTAKILSKVSHSDMEDFFEKIALFSSRNNRYQELKANCKAHLEMKYGKAINPNVTV